MKALSRLFDAAGWAAGVFLIGTLAMVLISIVGRLLPALALPGADAYAGYCMAAAAFLALPSTLRRGEHIRVTLVVQRLPGRVRRTVEIAAHGVGLFLAGALAWFSARLVWQSHTFHDISTGLDATPLWIPQLGMAVGALLLALAMLVQCVEVMSGRVPPLSASDESARVE
ncbi:MAG: TRAP transporter small permease [Tepidimonas sp.]|uniref:TRAP transporter small permease n=1 Tax=Tepidimonas sp. TaxID=2002775 RepID=UPI0040551832